MKKLTYRFLVLYCLGVIGIITEAKGQTTASSTMNAGWKAPYVAYDISDSGEEYTMRWGIDTAWLWSWWPLRASNHMQECAGLGRVTITPRTNGSYTALEDGQTTILDDQLSWLKKSKVKELYLLAGNGSGSAWQTSFRTPFVDDIAYAVLYLQNKGYEVVAIAPFNEPDYSANNAPGPEEMAYVARLLHQHSVTKNIPIAGPNCLNPDYANSWWNTMKNDLDIGNIHQLAGSFNNFANFYSAVSASGKPSAGDEMHNINDALIGMHYGMRDGIWWSDFGGYTRAELGRATLDGACIGYAENRNAWTSASVFKRHSENMAEGFLGTSERQAGESSYTFVSQDRLVYYDGHGPYYEYTKDTKGGNGYQSGQTNSEYVIEMTYGEDVPMSPLQGDFKIVNKATGKLLTASSLTSGSAIKQAVQSTSSSAIQAWTLNPVDKSAAGDFAYVTISTAKDNSLYLDATKYSGDNGASIQLYSGGGNECERWHFHYKGDGYYVITNHDSGLSLEGSYSNSSSNTTGVVQWARTGTDRQLWKLVPASTKIDKTVPSTPIGLQAFPRSGSILLSWDANPESYLFGYMVYRYNENANIWETIGRGVKEPQFIDNICPKGKTMKYKIRAVSQSWNLSEPSETVEIMTTSGTEKIGQWNFIENLTDATENHLDGVGTTTTFTTSDTHNGIVMNGSSDYICLPYHVADMNEMTISAWVKPTSTTAWQRVFDFGRNSENYLFFTPSNGSYARFEICKNGTKQGLNATKRLSANTWVHVAVTLKKGKACIYLDGKLNASTTDITYQPCDIRPVLSYLGRSMFDSDPLFKGTIGEVCIFNHALEEGDIQQLYYHDQMATAEEMLKKPMYKVTREALSKALEDVRNAIASNDNDAITSTLRKMNTALTTAKVSVTAYTPLGEALERSASLAKQYPQSNTEDLNNYETSFSSCQADYLEGTYTNSDIPSKVIAVKTFTNQYLMSDAQLSATVEKPVEITHLMDNPDFSGNNIDGWALTTNATSYRGDTQFECFEVWNHTFNLSQQLYGMPNGTYRLDTQAFYRNGTKENSASEDVNALLYINATTVPISPISTGANSLSSTGNWYTYATNKKVPNDMEAAAAAFTKLRRYQPTTSRNTVTAEYNNETTATLTVGIKKTKAVNDDWTIMNYFKLYYLGDPNATGISTTTNVESKEHEGSIYDLSGRKVADGASAVSRLAKGIYIIGGKKVVVE